MPLPRSERAVLDLRKLEDYCLDPSHSRGRHKARVFRDALGLIRTDARWLRDTLLAGVREQEAIGMAEDGLECAGVSMFGSKDRRVRLW